MLLAGVLVAQRDTPSAAADSLWGKNEQKWLFTKSLFYFINFSKSEKSTKAVQLCKGSIRPAVSFDEVSLSSSCPHGFWPCGSCPTQS